VWLPGGALGYRLGEGVADEDWVDKCNVSMAMVRGGGVYATASMISSFKGRKGGGGMGVVGMRSRRARW
jgi:hypothetical protein